MSFVKGLANPVLYSLAQLPLAYKHSQSQRVSVPSGSSELCDCCRSPISAQYRLSVDTEELSHLGLAFPLFFYMQRCLTAMLGIVAVFAAIVIGAQYYCSGAEGLVGDPRPLVHISGANQTAREICSIELIVVCFVAALVVMCVAFCGLTVRSRTAVKRLREKERSPAEFAIVVKNLGSGWQPQQLKEYLEARILKFAHAIVEVVDINVAYDLRQLSYYLDQIKTKTVDMNMISVNRFASKSCLCCCKKRRILPDPEALEIEITQAFANLKSAENTAVQAGVAFVSFANAEQARIAYAWLRQNIITETILSIFAPGHNLRFNSHILAVKRANAPSDINWSNLHKSRFQRIMRSLFSWTVLFTILITCFFIIDAVAEWQSEVKKAKAEKGFDYSSLVTAIVILALNTVLELAARKLAAFEGHHSFSGQSLSAARKLTIVLSLNTLLFPLMTNKGSKYDYMYDALGFNLLMVAVSALLSKPLLRYFDPGLILKWWKRYRVRTSLKGERVFIPQCAANQAFEPPEIDIVECYSDIMLRFLLAIIYSPLVPLIIPVTLIGFLLDYSITKWVLLKRAKHPKQLSEKLFQDMLLFVKVALVLNAYSMYSFYSDVFPSLKEYVKWAVDLSVVFALGHWLVFTYLIKEKPSELGLTRIYEEEKQSFRTVKATQTYASENPITRVTAPPERTEELCIPPGAAFAASVEMTGERRNEEEKSEYRLGESSLQAPDTSLLDNIPEDNIIP